MAKPKYEQVKTYLIDFIQRSNLKYGDSMPTEGELVRMFDVSRHTIRRALSDLVNQGWLYSMQGSGTFVADPNADRLLQGKMIGVITTYFKDYIFPDILSGIDDVVSEEGYNILLGTTKNNIARERVVLSNMLNNQLAGLIVEPTKSVYPNHNLDLYEMFEKRGIPVMYIHATYKGFPASYVVEDDVHAGFIATSHLLEIGHRKVIGLFKNDDMQGHGRYEGFIKAHREMGVECHNDQVMWFTTEERNTFINEKNLRKWLATLKEVTAFVCYNDQISMSLVETLKNLGYKVPEDYSIVSFDNSNMADKLDVKLTTVAHPKAELGKKAAETMLKLIGNKELRIEERIMPELIIRTSTKVLTH